MRRLFEASFPAIGTTAQVVTTSPGDLCVARDVLATELDAIDRACSRFREDSELSRVNAADGATIDVTPLFAEAIRIALRAARVTRGLVDPTVGRALIAIGYDRDFVQICATRSMPRFEPIPGWRLVELDEDASTVRVPACVALDLGATAKALAADRAARAASERTEGGVLINLGGDISVTGPAPEDGWPIRVTHDHRAPADAPGQTIHIRTGGLATSSTTARRWQTGAGSTHHIVNPATGWSAPEVWQTVSVAAASCVDANTAATAAIVIGADAPSWLGMQELPSRLVDPEGNVVRVAGWPEGDGR